MEAAEKLLSRLPIVPLILLGFLYLGYDYYNWLNATDSERGQRIGNLKAARKNLDASKTKLKQAEEFFRTLDEQRKKIRELAHELDETKAILNTEIDISNFIKMITLEAKKLKLTIKGIKPGTEKRMDYYVEVPFDLQLKGAYIQILLFFDRISKLHQVVKVADFTMKPTSNVHTKYVELEATAQILSFKYLGTHVDEIVNKPEMKSTPFDTEGEKK